MRWVTKMKRPIVRDGCSIEDALSLLSSSDIRMGVISVRTCDRDPNESVMKIFGVLDACGIDDYSYHSNGVLSFSSNSSNKLLLATAIIWPMMDGDSITVCAYLKEGEEDARKCQ